MKSEQILARPPRALSQEQREFYFESGHCTWTWQVPRSTGMCESGHCTWTWQVPRSTGMCESGYLLLEGFVSREWLNRIREVSNGFIERRRELTESNTMRALDPAHTAENPRLRRLIDPTEHHHIQLAESGALGLSDH